MELLIELGLSITDQSKQGWQVFMWACLGGHAAVVTKVLALGSSLGVKDREGRLGLHWAAEKGHAEAVGVLVREMLQASLDIQATVVAALHLHTDLSQACDCHEHTCLHLHGQSLYGQSHAWS